MTTVYRRRRQTSTCCYFGKARPSAVNILKRYPQSRGIVLHQTNTHHMTLSHLSVASLRSHLPGRTDVKQPVTDGTRRSTFRNDLELFTTSPTHFTCAMFAFHSTQMAGWFVVTLHLCDFLRHAVRAANTVTTQMSVGRIRF